MSATRTNPLSITTFTVAVALGALHGSCIPGRTIDNRNVVRNGGVASEFVARPNAGGHNEGPPGFLAPVSRSYLYEELASQGIHPETLGPLNDISDRRTLLAVMNTFTRALGVKCSFCHDTNNFAASTPRKAVAAYMWTHFVGELQLVDGRAVYCDSCHHASAVFLHRNTSARTQLVHYMQTEYVDSLRRRDGAEHGCRTCHGPMLNFRFLPRLSGPEMPAPPGA
jgi:hypothetical protein